VDDAKQFLERHLTDKKTSLVGYGDSTHAPKEQNITITEGKKIHCYIT